MAFVTTSLANLITYLTSRVGGNTTFWVTEEKRTSINEGLKIWQAYTGRWTKEFPLPAQSGVVFYETPRQIVGIQQVLYNGVNLSQGDTEGMDMARPGWQNSADGTPRVWMPVGLNMFAIYPPAASGTLLVRGMSEAPVLGNSGDKMDMADDNLGAILSYAHQSLTFKEGGAEFQAAQSGLQRAVEAAGVENGKLTATSFYRRLMGKDHAEAYRPMKMAGKSLGAR